MSERSTRVRTIFAWLLRHVAAAVALFLIISAFIVGVAIGRRTVDEAPDASVTVSESSNTPMTYTCSMHPSVRLTDPNAKCPICFMDLIPVTDAAGGAGGDGQLTLSTEAAKRSDVETARVGRFYPRAEVRLFGKVTYDETSVARLTAYVPGRIERLFVNYVGAPVFKDDHIAEVYSPELIAAFEELRQALAAASNSSASRLVRESSQQTLAASRDKLRLYGLTAEQIRSVEEGRFEGDRLTVYAPMGGVVTDLVAREGDYLEIGQPVATVANLKRLWLDLESYESQLLLLRWGQPVEFAVEAFPGELFAGKVAFIEPMVDEHTRTAAVRVAVHNEDGRLKPGMFASAVVRPRVGVDGAVLSDELSGRWISPMHPTVVKDGPGQCDVCGMDLVPAESLGVVGVPGAVEKPLVVPRSAVLFTGKRSVVYVRVADAAEPTFEGRQVWLGPRAGEFYVVRHGLEAGDEVVVNGAFRIDSAMQITARPSMMMPTDVSPLFTGEDEGATSGEPARSKVAPLRVDFAIHLAPVHVAYLAAQEALAADDVVAYGKAAAELNAALNAVDDVGVIGEPLGIWRRSRKALRAELPVADIEAARALLKRQSIAVIDLRRTFGNTGDETWYVAYCPMAFNDTGAEWMQRGKEINNPYFGDSMLRCGVIRETLPPNASGGKR